MAPNPTLVFIHGAWHGPESWQKHVIPALEEKGYRCIAEQIKFSGPEAKAGVGIKPSIEQIATLIATEALQGRDVVLVNHSFGGALGPSALPGLTTKDSSKLKEGSGHVIGIAQVSSFLVPRRMALLDLVGRHDNAFHFADEDGFEKVRPDHDPAHVFYGFCSEEEKARLRKELKPLASAVFEGEPGREGMYPGWLDVPTWYLRCTEDQAIPIQYQDLMLQKAQEAGADLTVRTVETDHSPFFSRPKETVEFIDEAVRSFKAH